MATKTGLSDADPDRFYRSGEKQPTICELKIRNMGRRFSQMHADLIPNNAIAFGEKKLIARADFAALANEKYTESEA